MSALTEQAISICRENYDKNCGGCPLRPECASPVGPGRQALDSWTEKVNQAAHELKEGERVAV